MEIPDEIPPEARRSLTKIRDNIAEINRLDAKIARSKWRAPVIGAIMLFGLTWAILKIISGYAEIGWI